MKSSKSNVRWAPALCRAPHPGRQPGLSHPPFCTVLQLTVTLCLVYITLNCNSLNRRPNFLYVYVQTFILTPCLAFITWTQTSE